MDEVVVQELQLSFAPDKAMLQEFLRRHNLKLEEDVECAFGIFSEGETLCGCGCAAGKVLKCFAIDDTLRGQGGLGALVSRLSANRFAAGYDNLFVITRPHNKTLFAGCGFHPIAETEQVLLLENRRDGVERFLRQVPRAPEGVNDVGAIVMNCNPLTNGHLALIRHAAQNCGFLYLFVVEENRSAFPFQDRLELVRRATEGMDHVCVCPSGPYMISSMTFPVYFLKETENPSLVQSELDITLFGSLIAPSLGIVKRFAGQEPLDPVTNVYNRTMERMLPHYGVAFCEISRAEQEGRPISASRVRQLLWERGGVTEELLHLVPPCTGEYLLKVYGRGKEVSQ